MLQLVKTPMRHECETFRIVDSHRSLLEVLLVRTKIFLLGVGVMDNSVIFRHKAKFIMGFLLLSAFVAFLMLRDAGSKPIVCDEYTREVYLPKGTKRGGGQSSEI